MNNNSTWSTQKKMGLGLVIVIVVGIIGLLIYRFVVNKGCASGYTGSKCDWVVTGSMNSQDATSPDGPVKAASVLDCANICVASGTSNCAAAVFDASGGLCYKKPKLTQLNADSAYTLVTPKRLDISKLMPAPA